MTLTPTADSAYGVAEIDLAADLQSARPGATLAGVQQIRVRGAFRSAAVVAGARLDMARTTRQEPQR